MHATHTLAAAFSYLAHQTIITTDRYNPKVRPMMLTLEKIQYVHRPLAYYALLTGLQVRTHAHARTWRACVCI